MTRLYGGPFGYGHKPDVARFNAHLPWLGHLFSAFDAGGPGPPPPGGIRRFLLRRAVGPGASLEQHLPPVMDQGSGDQGTSACTGHGTAGGLWTSAAASAAPLLWVPSPSGLYTVGRAIGRASTAGAGKPLPALLDGGAYPADVMAGLAWGIRPIQAPTPDGRCSDCSPATINDEPDLGQLEQDANLHLIVPQPILETGPAIVPALTAALDAWFAIGVGIFVDTVGPRSVEEWDPNTGPLGAPNAKDPTGGGHWVFIYGYEVAGGEVTFLWRNSWGEGWGIAGNGRGNETWAAGIDSAYVMTVRRASP